ncbi:DUF397 domain-containing protein [Pseudonocardia sp. CNS-139]|nr:DUF397 domain-containing protein [Pseudonocardia sp. CNS-139]
MSHRDATASNWHKSTFSGVENGCVEVGSAPGIVGVRDTKLGTNSPVLVFTTAEWAAFLTAVKNGQL